VCPGSSAIPTLLPARSAARGSLSSPLSTYALLVYSSQHSARFRSFNRFYPPIPILKKPSSSRVIRSERALCVSSHPYIASPCILVPADMFRRLLYSFHSAFALYRNYLSSHPRCTRTHPCHSEFSRTPHGQPELSHPRSLTCLILGLDLLQ
jgi:hypothetical protein